MTEPIVVAHMVLKQQTDYTRSWVTPGNYSVISVEPGEYPVFYDPKGARNTHCPMTGIRTLDSYTKRLLGASSHHERHPNAPDVYHLHDYTGGLCARVIAGECILVEGMRLIGEMDYSEVFGERRMYWNLEQYDSEKGWIRLL